MHAALVVFHLYLSKLLLFVPPSRPLRAIHLSSLIVKDTNVSVAVSHTGFSLMKTDALSELDPEGREGGRSIMPLLLGQSPDDNKMKSVYLISHVSPTLHKHTVRAHDGKRALWMRHCCISDSVPSWFQQIVEIERQLDRSCCPKGRAEAVYCYKPPSPVTSVNKTSLSDHRIHSVVAFHCPLWPD